MFSDIIFQDCELNKIRSFHKKLSDLRSQIPLKIQTDYGELLLKIEHTKKELNLKKSESFDFIINHNVYDFEELLDDNSSLIDLNITEKPCELDKNTQENITTKRLYVVNESIQEKIRDIESKINSLEMKKKSFDDNCESLYSLYDDICYFIQTVSIKEVSVNNSNLHIEKYDAKKSEDYLIMKNKKDKYVIKILKNFKDENNNLNLINNDIHANLKDVLHFICELYDELQSNIIHLKAKSYDKLVGNL